MGLHIENDRDYVIIFLRTTQHLVNGSYQKRVKDDEDIVNGKLAKSYRIHGYANIVGPVDEIMYQRRIYGGRIEE